MMTNLNKILSQVYSERPELRGESNPVVLAKTVAEICSPQDAELVLHSSRDEIEQAFKSWYTSIPKISIKGAKALADNKSSSIGATTQTANMHEFHMRTFMAKPLVTIDPNSNRIFEGSKDGRVYAKFIDNDGKVRPLGRLSDFQTGGAITSAPVLFNDGKHLVVTSENRRTYILRVDEERGLLKVGEFESLVAVTIPPAVSPDDRFIAIVDAGYNSNERVTLLSVRQEGWGVEKCSQADLNTEYRPHSAKAVSFSNDVKTLTVISETRVIKFEVQMDGILKPIG